jgi:hypothetical protein
MKANYYRPFYCKRCAKNLNLQCTSISKSNQIKSNQIKSNQIKSNQIKSNQIKSNQINIFSYHISSQKKNDNLFTF